MGEWTWCHCWLPLQGAIVVCYSGGRGGRRPTLGEWTCAIAGCHVVCYGLGVTTNFGGVDGGRCWVPLRGAIVVCYGGGKHFFFALITQTLFFAIWGLCWYSPFLWHRQVVATLQCGGNRRSELDQIEKTSGIPWGFGAMSTAQFGGVYLREARDTGSHWHNVINGFRKMPKISSLFYTINVVSLHLLLKFHEEAYMRHIILQVSVTSEC